MCVWHNGDIPRSTKVVLSGAAQKRHEKLRARVLVLEPGARGEIESVLIA